MLTAKEAALIACGGGDALKDILEEIEDLASQGEWSLTVGQDALDDNEKGVLRSLGYTVGWSRPLLEYTISWGGDKE